MSHPQLLSVMADFLKTTFLLFNQIKKTIILFTND